jgi:glucose/arabinose dehydrogenase
MRSRAAVMAAAALLCAACGPGTGSTGGQAAIGAGLRGPAGLRAAVYATGLPNMSAFAFDARGRLWVATAPYASQGQDSVFLVTAPGSAPVRAVTGLRTPLGLAWVGGWLYVASLGRVDAFGDFDGTRFTERRTILDGPVAGGENDGLVQTADGRLLMGVSASCDHCTPASPWSATIVSFAPDGTDLRVYASGIRAPYGLTLVPGTSDLFATMNQRDDLGSRTPGDWLSLVPRGSDWRFPDCYGQGGAVCAGVSAPTAVLEPHAAAGGVAIAGSSAIVSEWAKGRVLRVALTRTGSGYRGSVAPFLSGLRNPLPVVATADGAVLVGDWGTGTIYRVGPV